MVSQEPGGRWWTQPEGEEGKGPEMLLRHNGWDLSMRQASNLGNFSPMQNSKKATLGRDGVDIGQGQREGI